ncbi:hypothetical protein [Ottowia thiooxydans]|uniref:hypothetical protein n=1 Tax=Ottowia thiooxydans TaxID=219182 RepID=UPI000401A76B|nr:hypothetical protein [Ottowia thiooxydans]
MNRRVTSLLLGINLLLAIALGLLWAGFGGANRWEPPKAQPPNLDDARAALLRPHPESAAAFAQIVERPLFTAGRRPPPPPAPEAAPSAPVVPPIELDKVKMFGTINGPGLRGVLAEVEGKSRFVRSGEQIGEWTLRRVRSNEAVFEKGDEERVVPLPLAAGAAPKTAAASPTATPGARPAPARTSPTARPAPPSLMSQLPGMGLPPATPAPPAAPPGASPSSNSATDAPSPPRIRGSWGP